MRIRDDHSSLVTTTKAGLKNGMFDRLVVVDCKGNKFQIDSARKIRGVGLFWGYDLFLSQKIKVELLGVESGSITLEDLKGEIHRRFRAWGGWETRDDLGDLKLRIDHAKDFLDLIMVLKSARI